MPNQTYTPSQMAAAIASIGQATLQTKTTTQNGTVTPDAGYDGLSEVVVNVPTGGGDKTEANDVNFIDYDGTILYSYTAAEFANLTEMPANPTHGGLTSQGWNWTLAKAQAYVAKYGNLWIGQMYITDDGKTRVYISLEEGRLAPTCGFGLNGTAVINWGDGSTDTVTGTNVNTVINTQHTYAATGDYVITIDVTGSLGITGGGTGSQLLWKTSGNLYFNRVYQNTVQKVEIGRNTNIMGYAFDGCLNLMSITIPDSVMSIGNYMFHYCYSLASVTIPDGVTSIESNTFDSCYNLTSITIPDSVTSIGSSAFYNCYSLASITIPDGMTSIGSSAFYNCCSLTSITIPDSVTSIGSSAFYNCYSLASITIPDGMTNIGGYTFYNCYCLTSITIPNSVTKIGGYAFYNCYSLASITIPDGMTNIESNAFQGCYSLASITIPDGMTNIGGYAFQGCYSLASITIPDGMTSIGDRAFQFCYSLASITIPNSVTSIGSNAFQNCYGLGRIRFVATTPPTVASSNAWANIPTDCVIYVPSGTLAAYTSATNYPSSSTYTYVEY